MRISELVIMPIKIIHLVIFCGSASAAEDYIMEGHNLQANISRQSLNLEMIDIAFADN